MKRGLWLQLGCRSFSRAKGRALLRCPRTTPTRPPPARGLERFFASVYVPALLWKHKIVSICLLVLFTGYAIFSAAFAVQMEPPIKQEQWFPRDHMITRVQESDAGFFGGDEVEYLPVMLSWGIESVTRDQVTSEPAHTPECYRPRSFLRPPRAHSTACGRPSTSESRR
eukprot:SAG11_NODE_5430_length_1563_cov_1.012295_2_plen_169_part_00